MEHSKVWLLIKDIVSERGRKWKGNKQVVEPKQLQDPFGFIGSENQMTTTYHISRPTFCLFMIMTYHATITPL